VTRAVLLALALLLLAPAAGGARSPELVRVGTYLTNSLDARGCAAEPGGAPSANLTAWAALGLVAAGRSASAAAGCIASRSGELRSATDVQIAILALVAAGRDPRRAGGRNLTTLLTRQLRGGRIGPTVASNQFGILALRALGRRVPAAARATLLRDQNPDGSWPVAPGGDGDSNLTASGIAAAVAAGMSPAASALLPARTVSCRTASAWGTAKSSSMASSNAAGRAPMVIASRPADSAARSRKPSMRR